MDKRKQKIIRLIQAGGENKDIEILEAVNDLEDKVESFQVETAKKLETVQEEIPTIANVISKLKGEKGDSYIITEQDKAEIIESVNNLIDREELKGDDYILTEEDKADIASKIEVPIVEKVIQKTQVIREIPIVTEIVKEVAVADTAEDIRNKLEFLTKDERLDKSAIKGLEKIDNISQTLDTLDRRTVFLMSKPAAPSSVSIGSTVTNATQGSVLYTGASSTLAQDNANLFYDATNKRLGIGTTTPQNSLDTNNGSIRIGNLGLGGNPDFGGLDKKFVVYGLYPGYAFKNTSAAANSGEWDTYVGAEGAMYYRTLADGYGVGATWMNIARTGTVVTSVNTASSTMGTTLVPTGFVVNSQVYGGSPGTKFDVGGSNATGSVGTEDIFNIGRNTAAGVSWPQIATFSVGRAVSNGVNPETRLDIKLKNNADGTLLGDVTVATMTSGGNMGVGVTAPTASLDVQASTTSKASFRLRTGTAPTSPNDGDIWQDGTNMKIRIGGTTKTFTLT